MVNMKKKFESSFQTRMTIYFYVLTLIPVLITSLLLHQVSINNIVDMAASSSRQIVDSAGKELDELMLSMSSLPLIIRSDASFQRMLRTEYQSETARVTDESKGTATLASLNEFQPDIYGIYVLMDNGAAMKSRYFDFQMEDFRTSTLYQNVRAAEGPVWFTPDQGSMLAETVGDPIIACGMPMRDIITGEPRGIIMVEARKFLLQKKLALDIGKGGELFLLDQQLNTVALARQSPQEDYLKKLIASLQKEQFDGDSNTLSVKDGILVYHRLSANGWYVAGFIPQSALREKGKIISLLVAVLAIFFWAMICFAATRVSRYELKPIRIIVQTIKKIEKNDLHARCEVVRRDEIGAMAASFNQMTAHVLQLNENIRLEQERLRQAEFRALQAQIQPHFLYNTLDSIVWLSRKQENQKVIHMVMALTDFFRTSLSRGADIIPVSVEVEHVTSYLKIQKIRYESLFDYDIFVDPASEQYLIPKLILQPIVENALYHGIKPSGRHCMIHINIFDQPDCLLFEVLDDGNGIPPDKLLQLKDALRHCETTPSHGLGMVNVNDRIQSFSGGKFGLSIASDSGMGTLVTLRIGKMAPRQHE
ncbi:sensor histidine kinase [Butyricicoccus faecihominis]|uniref:cache domain-containing sensor histidine kinase n=1 Tax=Butyricicoccus faecihominis TaxID=1712515 RepID=UPI00247B1CA0|nr:sensor histidine kinase [Butyricicoccus faecihominis]MCQ5128277.1 sensor histidine kinase [Butyricicoccus faecihominis]